mmetsp:Transcript_3574/g.10360  ORF Transcript_3574/g.10360 Transcript_3574/m.10360 type:complete len:119 (+) Transcript_3574:370-726(+)
MPMSLPRKSRSLFLKAVCFFSGDEVGELLKILLSRRPPSPHGDGDRVESWERLESGERLGRGDPLPDPERLQGMSLSEDASLSPATLCASEAPALPRARGSLGDPGSRGGLGIFFATV